MAGALLVGKDPVVVDAWKRGEQVARSGAEVERLGTGLGVRQMGERTVEIRPLQ